MSKDETGNGGLFSKVVKFVRNPATNWADLDQKEADRESTYTKQALKEMIERKRRNDFVRKREFDMLRKMRRREAMSGTDAAQRPSFFQSSLPSKPDDRAMTLKKIDEIEAQMSMQWWKTKHGDSSLQSSNFPSSNSVPMDSKMHSSAPQSPSMTPATHDKTEPASLAFGKSLPPPGFSRTAPPSQPAAIAPRKGPNSVQRGSSNQVGGLAASYDGASTGFSASKLFAVEVAEVAHDAELEEASIRFANGDDAAAEAGLRDALKPGGSRVGHEETWLALFDLYRAIGQQEKFDRAAIEFARYFGRSAPIWFSIPDLVQRMTAPTGAPAADRASDWISPPAVNILSLAKLKATVTKADAPWTLDWSGLQSIEPAAAEPMRRLFVDWASQAAALRFVGAERLDLVLKAATPSGRKDVSPEWWKLRMEALRLMRRPEDFELVALDYCVTYEVSPPAWEAAHSAFQSIDASGAPSTGNAVVGHAVHESAEIDSDDGFGDTLMGGSNSGQSMMTSTIELAGQIQGDATAALDKLEARADGADVMMIACAKLIRVDFSAAGTLLNWVTTQQTQGRVIQFSDVHRLVAAFFHVIGINEHARITLRQD